jgi:beta-lactamase superfamily II metal-dependent hydrolase
MKSPSPKLSASRAVTAAVFSIAVVLACFILFRGRERIFAGTPLKEPVIKVTYFYVGQGDASLVRDLRQDGKTVLIDAGPSAEAERELSGNYLEGKNHAGVTIIPYLEKQGIEKIDYMVASHKDADHIGGLAHVIRNFRVKAVYDNGTKESGPYVKDFFNAVKESSVKLVRAKPGMELDFGKGIVCQILAPLRAYKDTEGDENNSSIVVRITAGKVSFMFGGDIEIPAELDLMGYGKGIRTTVYKASHHGSASSNSNPFLDLIKPDAAIFSCGRYNPYGFLPFEIIRRFEQRGAKIYRTDYDGNIEVISDGYNYRVITQR